MSLQHPLARAVPACLAASLLLQPGGPVFAQASAAAVSDDRSAASLVEAARTAARANRNREAADLLALAIARDPARRAELLQEYADQLTYSQRAARAVPLYRELLATRTGAARLPVLKGLGHALLWSDRPSEARAVYEEILQADPRDQDASRNHARALSWSGRQRAAIVALRTHLASWPDDPDARVQLAQAQAWLGRPDQARDTLAQGSGGTRDDARRLLADLQTWAAPQTRLDAQRSSQSDRLDIRQLRFEHMITFDRGLGGVGARVDRIDFDREDGSDSVRSTRPMVLARYRFADALELHAEAGNEHIAPLGSPAMDRLVYASWLTFWPNDVLRVDASTSRSTFDNIRSLRLGLTGRQYGLSADLTPSERERYTARIEHGLISDGNRRWRGELETEYRWHTHPDAWIGLKHVRMRFAKILDNGYFNPHSYDATLATARFTWKPAGDEGPWEVQGSAAWGREHADPDGSKPAYDAGLRLAYRFDRRTRVEARLQRFSTRTSSFSGFARTTAGVQLERSW
jgi:tetratricopeptide (TPR) repeat protein